jgi:hypothetical protein
MITKTVYEEFFRYHEFRRADSQGWLNESETLSSCEVKCHEKDTDADKSSAMVSDAGVYNNTKVKYKLKAGESGKLYYITIKAVTSNSQKFEDRLDLAVG